MSERERAMKEKNLGIRSLVYGAIGALVGVLPISIVKTIVFWPIPSDQPFLIDLDPYPLWLTLWGVVYDTWHFDTISFLVYLLCILIGGAVFGFFGTRFGLNRFQKRRDNSSQQKWKGAFWWSFLFGIFFDFIFTFMWLYPGQ
jgi:hypothetical protein